MINLKKILHLQQWDTLTMLVDMPPTADAGLQNEILKRNVYELQKQLTEANKHIKELREELYITSQELTETQNLLNYNR
jgi:hypothetical protein